MATAALHSTDTLSLNPRQQRAEAIAAYLGFLRDTRRQLKTDLVAKRTAEVATIQEPLEEHYLDDQGQAAMYQHFESALYDDARTIVTLWNCFDRYQREELAAYQKLTELEITGLTGDRHPRKVFDRSPFGVAALMVGTITIWMTVFQTYSGEDLTEFLELIRFNAMAGMIWIVGLFVVVWYILKTHRNNAQVAFLSSLSRAIQLYLDDSPK